MTSVLEPSVQFDTSGLIRLGRAPRLGEYLRSLWRRREFAIASALGTLRARNMDTVLGNLWHLLNPILQAGIYYLIFGVILDARRGIRDYPTFLITGVLVFGYSRGAIIGGARSIASNFAIIRSLYFPRALLPLSTVVAETVAHLPALLVMITFALVMGHSPRLSWLLLLPLVILQFVFNLGSALFVSRLGDRFHDFQNLLPFVFRMLFYGSGVIFSIERVRHPLGRLLFELNPFYAFVAMNRWILIREPTSLRVVVVGVTSTVIMIVGGFLFFRARENEYGSA